MKKPRNAGGFFLSLLFGFIFNLEWSIPAWILLILHFVIEISIWWFVGALALWAAIILCQAIFIHWASKCSNEPRPQTKNKNPYSVRGDHYEKLRNGKSKDA